MSFTWTAIAVAVLLTGNILGCKRYFKKDNVEPTMSARGTIYGSSGELHSELWFLTALSSGEVLIQYQEIDSLTELRVKIGTLDETSGSQRKILPAADLKSEISVMANQKFKELFPFLHKSLDVKQIDGILVLEWDMDSGPGRGYRTATGLIPLSREEVRRRQLAFDKRRQELSVHTASIERNLAGKKLSLIKAFVRSETGEDTMTDLKCPSLQFLSAKSVAVDGMNAVARYRLIESHLTIDVPGDRSGCLHGVVTVNSGSLIVEGIKAESSNDKKLSFKKLFIEYGVQP